MKQYADLHVHTHMSDGSDSVEEVLRQASDNNVSFLSITDHNTLDAYKKNINKEAEKRGIQLLPGVELDVIHKQKQYHLLAYGIDIHNAALQEACTYNCKVQEQYNFSLLQCMIQDGLALSESEYQQYMIPSGRGGWKLLNYLLDAGVTHSLLEGTKYYRQYGFDSNHIAFISLEEAIGIVKGASGIPVLAHPAEQIPYSAYDQDHDSFWTALEELLQTQIEGIECIHPLHGFELQEELIALCKERGLFISGGTDYHGRFFNKQKQRIGGQFISADIVKSLIMEKVQ
ncbi:MAG: PHP domain-containing protein [Lachnospiraceae bacterium]|jgi:predicted metal-dependent phosphoesterase TrpH|nr:PHP domain-containing protein [Lachnospiraceae bacterium]